MQNNGGRYVARAPWVRHIKVELGRPPTLPVVLEAAVKVGIGTHEIS